MTIQDKVWLLTLTGIAAVALGFLFVVLQTARRADAAEVEARSSSMRRRLFAALIVLGIGATGVTLIPFPIPSQQAPPVARRTISAVGHQWAWQLNPCPITAGETVEFRVTSADVNHGFGIYNAAGQLLAQTQAMPGVTNRLVHTFAEPGKYRILCLEYCGLAHHGMFAEFEVVDGTVVPP
jgi:cytochrome c oxidase subunit 2